MKIVCSLLLLALAHRACLATPVSKKSRLPSTSSDSSSILSSHSDWQPSSDTLQSTTSNVEVGSSVVQSQPVYHGKIAENRAGRVAKLEQAFEKVKETILIKDPLTMTVPEQHEVALMRIKIQRQLDSLSRSEEPYLDALRERLRSMRARLTRQTDYHIKVDIDEKRRRNGESVARDNTRTKVNGLGLGITIKAQTPAHLRPRNDGAPVPIANRRSRQARVRARKRVLQEAQRQRQGEASGPQGMTAWEREKLFAGAWGRKGQLQ